MTDSGCCGKRQRKSSSQHNADAACQSVRPGQAAPLVAALRYSMRFRHQWMSSMPYHAAAQFPGPQTTSSRGCSHDQSQQSHHRSTKWYSSRGQALHRPLFPLGMILIALSGCDLISEPAFLSLEVPPMIRLETDRNHPNTHGCQVSHCRWICCAGNLV